MGLSLEGKGRKRRDKKGTHILGLKPIFSRLNTIFLGEKGFSG